MCTLASTYKKKNNVETFFPYQQVTVP